MKNRITAALTAAILTISFTVSATAEEPQVIPQDSILTNGKPITEENVLEILHQLEVEWPARTPWDDPKLNPDTCKNAAPSTETGRLMWTYRTNRTYGCGGYASMISSRIFGDQVNPCRQLEDLTQIRPDDVIFRVSNATGRIWHITVALESPNDLHSYHITDAASIAGVPDGLCRSNRTSRHFLCEQTVPPAFRPVSTGHCPKVRDAGRNRAAHHTAYVPSLICHASIGRECGYPVYPMSFGT